MRALHGPCPPYYFELSDAHVPTPWDGGGGSAYPQLANISFFYIGRYISNEKNVQVQLMSLCYIGTVKKGTSPTNEFMLHRYSEKM